MSFFEGALSYEYLKNMPLPELAMLHEEASRINTARKAKK
jgi:hypothetical protein